MPSRPSLKSKQKSPSRTPSKPRAAFPQRIKLANGPQSPDMPLWARPGFLIRRLHQIHYALFFEECAAFDVDLHGSTAICWTRAGA